MVQAGIDAYATNFADANGGALGLDLRYPELFAPKEQAALLTAQLAERPQAVAVTIPAAQVEQALVQGLGAGTPLYTYNAGLGLAAKLGTRSHLGQDELDAGRRAGEYWGAQSVGVAYCLNHRRGLQVRRAARVWGGGGGQGCVGMGGGGNPPPYPGPPAYASAGLNGICNRQ